MTHDEIVRQYQQAKNPERQIGIMSDLTLKTIPEIKEILINKGVYKDMAITWTTEKEKQLRQMKKEGLPTTKIAERLGGTDSAINNKWKKLMAADKAKANTVSAPDPKTMPAPVAKAPININVSERTDSRKLGKDKIDLSNDMWMLSYELTALVDLLRITHEDGLKGIEKDYYKTADKYNIIIPMLEDVAKKYERLSNE